MTSLAELRAITYTYPGADAPALRNVSLAIEAGAFVLVAGPSASGKSTLLRLFNGLVPQFHGGRLAGAAAVAGLDPFATPARRMARVVGMVFQEPEAQAIAETVQEEIVFGMEQQAIAPAEMRRRLERLLTDLGIGHLRHRRLATLSGGERQRVAIAAVLALEPQLLVLDEPTSQLDGDGAASVLATIEVLRRRGDLAILLAEHRLERLLHRVDAVVAVAHGEARRLTAREAAAALPSLPAAVELARRLGLDPLPLSLPAVGAAIAGRGLLAAPRPAPAPGAELLRAEGLAVRYGAFEALRGVSLHLREGEVVALVGPNGSGKTTLFRALAGLVEPAAGSVTFAGVPAPRSPRERTAHAGLVPQDPALALYQESVAAELAETLRHRGLPRGREELAALARAWSVEGLLERDPRDLSVGQQQRVAIAAMLAHGPRTWLMDEPTRGMDGPAKAWLAARLREHAAAGGAAIVATHDIESAAHYATRVVGLREGEIAFDLPARRAFAADGPLPTQAAQLVPGAITLDEVVIACAA
ncbi:ATP-binding cassette domain-containing protein [Tepidiforma sp.]|uniref:ABC transporter ATP-binding protein n=1 Tax=Tepidiforma sp. TaxID=2682230 RepID=UPI002ADE500C|nr:ATP-binding cassette domain-containing protein [Tepidiforma sp.]